MLLRRVARPLFATWFVAEGVDVHVVGLVEAPLAAEVRVVRDDRLHPDPAIRLDVPDRRIPPQPGDDPPDVDPRPRLHVDRPLRIHLHHLRPEPPHQPLDQSGRGPRVEPNQKALPDREQGPRLQHFDPWRDPRASRLALARGLGRVVREGLVLYLALYGSLRLLFPLPGEGRSGGVAALAIAGGLVLWSRRRGD